MLTQQEFDLFLRGVAALEKIADTLTQKTEISRAAAVRGAIHDAKLSELSEKLVEFAKGFSGEIPPARPGPALYQPLEAPPRPLKRAGELMGPAGISGSVSTETDLAAYLELGAAPQTEAPEEKDIKS